MPPAVARVADVGCGPGHVTAHLHKLGVDAFGVDLSPAMIDLARREHPDLRFEVGSMTDLQLADASITALLAFWSLIHVPRRRDPGGSWPLSAGGASRWTSVARLSRRR